MTLWGRLRAALGFPGQASGMRNGDAASPTLEDDGLTPTDAEPPTRQDLVNLGILEGPRTTDRSGVDYPLEGSLAARRRARFG